MAITGIVMMAYADGFHGDSFVGVALAVGSASTSALYKVQYNLGFISRSPNGHGPPFDKMFISGTPISEYFH